MTPHTYMRQRNYHNRKILINQFKRFGHYFIRFNIKFARKHLYVYGLLLLLILLVQNKQTHAHIYE